MLKALRYLQAGYFTDKNYGLIYIHHLLKMIGHAAMYFFTGAFFLEQGMPLHFVLLFYMLEYGLRGLLCPFGLVIFNRFGVLPSLILSCVLKIIFFMGVTMAQDNLWLGFLSFIFYAFSAALYAPFSGIIEAIYVKDDHNRNKQKSLGIVFGAIGQILGSAGVGYILVHYGFNYVVLFISLSLIMGCLPFLFMRPYKRISLENYRPRQVYDVINDQDFRPLLPIFFGQQIQIIMKFIMAPLFIYSILGDLEMLGYIIALTLIVEKIIVLASGHYTDRLGVDKAFNALSVSYPLSMIGYMVMAKTPLILFFLESFHNINGNIFQSSFYAWLHKYSRKHFSENLLLFATGWEVVLCLGEFIVLPFFVVIAYFIGMNVFYIAAALTIAAIWFIKYKGRNIMV